MPNLLPRLHIHILCSGVSLSRSWGGFLFVLNAGCQGCGGFAECERGGAGAADFSSAGGAASVRTAASLFRRRAGPLSLCAVRSVGAARLVRAAPRPRPHRRRRRRSGRPARLSARGRGPAAGQRMRRRRQKRGPRRRRSAARTAGSRRSARLGGSPRIVLLVVVLLLVLLLLLVVVVVVFFLGSLVFFFHFFLFALCPPASRRRARALSARRSAASVRYGGVLLRGSTAAPRTGAALRRRLRLCHG